MMQLSRDDYTVAWICALGLELTAAKAMLDEDHEDLDIHNDDNAYILGRIGRHNIVIATLPIGGYGTVSATAVVTQLTSSFPSIRVGLLVGIGGGIPKGDTDIRLGDVVVSKPAGMHGGVVQHDLGKAIRGGNFERTGILNRPPLVFLTAINKLEATKTTKLSLIIDSLSEVKTKLPSNFLRPIREDRLYHADYIHVDMASNTCEGCDRTQAHSRPLRENNGPVIHYGLIVSGNLVVKDSKFRDKLGQELGACCVEMEAAGVMNYLPCLVIRGICDYTDSHKNNDWQGYAAAVAAAYAKQLLLVTPTNQKKVTGKPSVSSMSPEEKKCFHDLFITDPEEDKTALKRIKGDRVPGTCDWILQSNELKIWLGEIQESSQQMPNILWLYGNPGKGKSTMAVTLAEELPARISSSTGCGNLAYFFCDSKSEHRRTATTILRGLLYQLIKQQPQLVGFLQPKYAERGERLFSSFDALWAVFIDIAKDGSSGRKYIIIDALDECDQESYEMLLRQLNLTFSKENFRQSMSYIHILITSRPYQEIREELEIYYHKDLTSFDKTKEDIQIFINQKVKELQVKKRYTKSVTSDVSRILSEKAEGTFLWIGIACGELYKVSSQDAVKKLESLPRGLHAIYRTLIDAALTRDQSETNQETIMQILSFVAISQRPLTLGELAIACRLYSNEDEAERREFTRNDVESCRLLVIIQEEKVFLLHKSVKDFLIKHACVPVDELATHARLAYRCVDYLLEYIDSNSNKHSGNYGLSVNDDRSDKQFICYSVNYWAKHAHLARSKFTVESRHAKFFDFSSPQREKWLELYKSRRYLLEITSLNWTIFHVAAIWGLVPVVKYIFSKKAHMGGMQQFDNMEFEASGVATPLEICARHGHSDVMALLLERGHEKMVLREAVVVAAADSSGNGKEIMRLLLDQRGDQVPITEKVIERVAHNVTNGADMMELLLDQRGDQVLITEEVMEAAAGNWGDGKRIIQLLLDRQREVITERVMEVAAGNSQNAEKILWLLLDRQGDRVPITERMMGAAARNSNGAAIIQLLLDRRGDRVPITERVIEAAASNGNVGEEIMRLLLDRQGDRVSITERVMEAAASNGNVGEEIMRLLLDRQGDRVSITERVMEGAASNANGTAIIKLLLDRRGDQVLITERVALAAACNRNCGEEILKALIENEVHIPAEGLLRICENSNGNIGELVLKRATQILMPAEILEATAKNGYGGTEIIQLLLDQRPDHVPVTEEMMERAAGNPGKGAEIIQLLFDRQGDQVPVTEEVILAAATNPGSGKDIIRLLLDRQGHKVQITEKVLHSTAKNLENGKEIMEMLLGGLRNEGLISAGAVSGICETFDARIVGLLLDQRKYRVLNYQRMMNAAANNYKHGEEVIKLLLERAGDQVVITENLQMWASRSSKIMQLLLDRKVPMTEKVLEAAASNKEDGEKMIRLVLAQQGDQLLITEEVIKAAAGNQGSAKKILQLLLDWQGGQAPITQKVMEEAAQNWANGADVIRLLLDKRGDQVPITEEVILAAAKNTNSGKDIIRLLLDRQRDQVPITQRVIEAAASNRNMGEETIQLLLDRQGDQVPITERVMEAAASNRVNGKKIMQLLLDRRKEQVIITENLLRAAARGGNKKWIVRLLLAQKRDQVHFSEEAIATIVENFESGVVRELLGQQGDQAPITEEVVKAAARNWEYGREVIRLLLDQGGDQVYITENVVQAVAGNEGSGRQIMKLLVDLQGNQLPVTETVMKAAAGNWGNGGGIMRVLLDELGDPLPITEPVMKIAAGNREEIIRVLLDHLGDRVPITESVMEAAVGKVYGTEIIRLLLDRRGGRVPITEKVLEAAAACLSRAEELMSFLLHQRDEQILVSENVVVAAAGNRKHGGQIIRLLLDRRGDQVPITGKVVDAAARNSIHREEIIRILLDKKGDQVQFSEEAAARICQSFGVREVKWLLNRQSDQVQIFGEVVEAAAKNWRHGGGIVRFLLSRGDQVQFSREAIARICEKFSVREVQLLLDKQGDQTPTIEEMVKAAACNWEHGKGIVRLLLDQQDQVLITENVVEAAASNGGSGDEIIRLLLDQQGDQLPITEQAMEAAAGNKGSEEIIKLLLDQKKDQVSITESMMQAAAGNECCGEQIMRLLLDQKGDQAPITENVMQAAAGNEKHGEEIIELLLDKQGDRLPITGQVLEKAASNEWYGEQIMRLLLDQKGDQAPITEQVINEAAGNKRHGEQIMRLLLDQKRDRVLITEETVKVAVGNEWCGERIMRLLLDQKGDQVLITEETVKAAVGNERCGEQIMRLLLDQKGDQLPITERVMEVVANSRSNTVGILGLLQQRGYCIATKNIPTLSRRLSYGYAW